MTQVAQVDAQTARNLSAAASARADSGGPLPSRWSINARATPYAAQNLA